MSREQKIAMLIGEASKVAHVKEFNTFARNYSGKVGCALLAKNGKVYTGVSIDLVCGLGNCAEYAAIANMVKDQETVIDMIVAIYDGKGPISPCGRCRELMIQVDKRNADANIVLDDCNVVKLSALLPELWSE